MMRALSCVGAANRCGVRRIVIGVVLTSSVVTSACAAREYHVRGTVTTVNPTHIEVKHKSGQLVAIAVGPTTVYRWDHTPAFAGDVEVGARVMVLFEQRRGPFAATEVRIFTRPSRAPRPKSRVIAPRRLVNADRVQE